MLTENDVVKYVSAWLSNHGYEIEAALETSERGIDIEARRTRPKRRLLVEAKGGTSSKKSTARFGAAFSRNQCRTHLAVALLTATRLRDANRQNRDVRVAIALPDAEPHLALVAEIERGLQELAIGVVWVSLKGRVRIQAPWRL